MEYYLRFYTVSPKTLKESPDDPAKIHAFIEATGDMLGELEFAAGESVLFVTAVEEVTGANVAPLLSAPVREAEPDDNHEFGGLDREDAENVLAAIDQFLSEASTLSSGLAAACEKFDLSTERFLRLLRSLRNLLFQAVEGQGTLVTLYAAT